MRFNNQVLLIGGVSKNGVEVKQVKDHQLAKFSMFVSDGKVKDEHGNEQPVFSYWDIECWDNTAAQAAALTPKTRIVVQGSLKEDKWTDEQGNMRSKVKIIADTVFAGVPAQPQQQAQVAQPQQAFAPFQPNNMNPYSGMERPQHQNYNPNASTDLPF